MTQESKQDFTDFYRSELLPELKVLEQQRHFELHKRHVLIKISIVFAFMLWAWLVIKNRADFLQGNLAELDVSRMVFDLLFWGFHSCVVAIAVAFVLLFVFEGNRFQNRFRQQFVPMVLGFFGTNFKFSSEASIHKNHLINSEFVPSGFHDFEAANKISGFVQGRFIQISQFDIRKDKAAYFEGTWFTAEFNKNFFGRVLVYSGSNFYSSYERVKLEDPEFERHFQVFATNQVEARYILSTSMMARLLMLRKKLKREISVSFSEDQVHLLIHGLKILEPPLSHSVLGMEFVHGYLEQIDLVIGIFKDLDLQTRIWSKEESARV
jgi:Protein of unknown function (DUF3137)